MTIAILLATTYLRLSGVLWGIAAGPDGNLWFPTTFGVVRMTPAGASTLFSASTITGGRANIAAGPDGRMWFTEPFEHRIGAVTMTGTITQYALPADMMPMGISAGADGNVWFGTGNAVGRITPSGGVTLFPLGEHHEVLDLVAGSDGNVWFVEWPQSSVGRITPEGIVTHFAVPCCGPIAIERADDGALWIAEEKAILRMTTAGEPTVVLRTPDFITALSNGWFATDAPRIANVAGRSIPLGGEARRVNDLAAMPDGSVWATVEPPIISCTLACLPGPLPTPVGIVHVDPNQPRRRAIHSR